MSSSRRIKRQRRRLPDNIYETKRYKTWRRKVFKRDKHTCRMCNADNCWIEAHHIHKKSMYPHLMYRTNNGVTLCEPCHQLVTGRESVYVPLFQHIIKGTLSNVFLQNWRKSVQNGERRWMQKRGVFRHLRKHLGQMPQKPGIIKKNKKILPTGMRKVRMFQRPRRYERTDV